MYVAGESYFIEGHSKSVKPALKPLFCLTTMLCRTYGAPGPSAILYIDSIQDPDIRGWHLSPGKESAQ